VTLTLATLRYREAEYRAAQIDAVFEDAWGRALNDVSRAGGDLRAVLREELKQALERDLRLRMERQPGHPVYAYWWEPGDPGTAQEADLEAIRHAKASLADDLASNSPKEMALAAERLLREHKLPEQLLGPLTFGLIEVAIRAWEVAERRTLGIEPLVFTAEAPEGSSALPSAVVEATQAEAPLPRRRPAPRWLSP
jgi:hypothetical protein